MEGIVLLYINMYFINLSEKYSRENDEGNIPKPMVAVTLIQLVLEPAE
jgi:hypothetical protein